MERTTKLVVVGWTCAALAAQVWLSRNWGWPALPAVAIGCFVTALALAAWDRRSVALVLAFTYVFPAAIWATHGSYVTQFSVLWMAALFGGILPASIRTAWHIPTPWRAPLVHWALVVAAGASIVVLREIDFSPHLIHVGTIANSARGGWPAFVISWVLQVALVLVLGILWFDWLFGTPGVDFQEVVVEPLAASGLVMTAAAIYQLVADPSFLNKTVYGAMGRAGGTLLDANVAGTLAAMWMGGVVMWAHRLGRWRLYALTCGLGATWLTVWASESRTALALAAIVTAFSLPPLVVVSFRGRTRLSPIRLALMFSIAGVLLLILLRSNLAISGPIHRLQETLPYFQYRSPKNPLLELWNREGYGPLAVAMIRRFPLVGVGPGSFQLLANDFNPTFIATDNAQNWYRHQFSEFGLLGSVGWICWVAAFAVFVLRRHTNAPMAAWAGRGILVGFALISLVGMPGQELTVVVTFWTMAFWYVSVVGIPSPVARLKGGWWTVSLALLIVYAASTAYLAAKDLRVPIRAQRVGWPYSYGFYPPEPDAAGGERRWTEQRAVAVVEAPTRWLELTVSVNFLALIDGGNRSNSNRPSPIYPVRAVAWRDGEVVVDARLTDTSPVTRFVQVPRNEPRILLETWVSRVFRPRDFGVADDRELGLLVKWRFVDAPPREFFHLADR